MLALKDDDGVPVYSASDVKDFYLKDGRSIFLVSDVPNGGSFFIILFATLVIGAIFYSIGACCYNRDNVSDQTREIITSLIEYEEDNMNDKKDGEEVVVSKEH